MNLQVLAREHMVESQLLTGTMLDERILAAMASVDRARFVEKRYQGNAYVDGELSVGEGRSLLEPLVFARMLLAAEIAQGDTVLDVACASGYGMAVLSRLAAKVVGIESNETLARRAVQNLLDLQATNATLVLTALAEAYHPMAPYDAIIIEGGVDAIPHSYREQLREGGRLVAIENAGGDFEGGRLGKIVLYRKTGLHMDRREMHDAASVPLYELRPPETFAF